MHVNKKRKEKTKKKKKKTRAAVRAILVGAINNFHVIAKLALAAAHAFRARSYGPIAPRRRKKNKVPTRVYV